jgi:hypothetical protein
MRGVLLAIKSIDPGFEKRTAWFGKEGVKG